MRQYLKNTSKSPFFVIAAKAGIQRIVDSSRKFISWAPAFAGATDYCRGSLILLMCWAPFSLATDMRITREGLDFYISARTPEQTNAFYSARGLPLIAVQEIAKYCFLTVGLHNRSTDIVWLDLATWRFTDASGRAITRISLPEWTARWKALQVPLAAQATFGWTQLPETRDMQPDENVGGNVPVVPPQGEFTLIARFPTGAAGKGKAIEIIVPGLSCPRDGAVK